MDRTRRRLLSLSGALAAAALAGCAADGVATDGGSPPDDATADDATDGTGTPGDTATDPPPSDPDVEEGRLATLAEDNAAFALDLHRQLAGVDGDAGDTGGDASDDDGETGGDQFLSPYSVSVALAMTFAGARGETREEMREVLRYGLGEAVHPAFADMRAVLASRETAPAPAEDDPVDAFRLNLANALWGREGFAFAEEFLALLDRHYGAGLRRADFAGNPAGERERINEWVADATEGKIEDLLPRGAITPDTALVLANAIYIESSASAPPHRGRG